MDEESFFSRSALALPMLKVFPSIAEQSRSVSA
jgi:hypothetical protein